MNSSPYRKNHPLIGIFWIGFALFFCGAGVASAQINGTWTGADGATWNTSNTSWSGVTGTPWNSTNGTTSNATFTATSGSASVSGNVSCYGDNRIWRVSPKGKKSLLADDPTSTVINRATNIAFGGTGRKTLYIANLGGWHISMIRMEAPGQALAATSKKTNQ